MSKFYKSAKPVYIGGRYYKPGEPFVWEPSEIEVTDDDGKTSKGKTKPGEDWEEVKAAEAAAMDASTDRVPDDANLETADKSALQAVAIMKHVTITGLDKKALIDAIKAAYEPKL